MYPWTSRVRWGFFLILKKRKTRRVFWAPFRLFSAGNRNADREPFLNRLVCGEWGGRRKCNSFVTVLYKHIQLLYIFKKEVIFNQNHVIHVTQIRAPFFFATKGAARYIQWALWKKKTSFSVCNVWEIHHRKSVSPPQAKNPKLPAVCLRRSRGPSVPSFFFFFPPENGSFFFFWPRF